MLIDSHCHLEGDSFVAEGEAVIARARAAGVGGCVTVCTRLATFPKTLAVAERFEKTWCSVGIHPEYAAEEPLDEAGPLLALCNHPKVVGIGETGLDYYYKPYPRERQMLNFRAHIAASRVSGLPLIVHTRDAEDDTIAILEAETAKGAFPGVLHCFSGTKTLAEAGLRLGFYVSASGILSFRNAAALREVFSGVPLDRLLVETDSPYLAPVPLRGKRNEPSFVVHTAAVLAELKGVSVEELAGITTENFFRLFAKAAP
jgi:TatD DNase family protein